MENLNFDDGYKEFTINNDESKVIRFNPSDFAIFTRLTEAKKVISEAISKVGDIEIDAEGKAVDFEKAGQMVENLDKIIKEQVDYVFNSSVSEKVFGNQSPMSNVGGKSLFERFFECIEPVISEALTEQRKESKKRVAKYTQGVK